MSEERQKNVPGKSAAAASRRPARDKMDQLKIYGDADDPRSARIQRNEKTPMRKKRRQGKAQAQIERAFGRIVSFIRDDGGDDRASFFGLRGRQFWLILALVAVVMLLGVTFLEGRNLSVDTQTITIVGLESELEGYRILHLSDLRGRRFGDKQSTLLREIETLNYDIIVMTGDMVGPSGDPTPFYELLEGLPASKKLYFIAGDSDPGPYLSEPRSDSGVYEEVVLEDWIIGALERKKNAVYVNQPVQVAVGSTSIWLTPANMLNYNLVDAAASLKDQAEQENSGFLNGIQADYLTLPFTEYHRRIMQNTLNALEQMQENQLHISLAHVPPSSAFIEATSTHAGKRDQYLSQPELILAGHYCGGVWRIPFFGAFYMANSTAPRYGWFPAQEAVAGLSRVGETQMYISSGLSTCSDVQVMPFRLFNRPQISLLTLTATLPTSMLED